MNQFIDIQKIVWDRLNALRGIKDDKPNEVALSDYFISRQYINIYEQELIVKVLGKVGENLIMFANLVDAEHPDLTKVLGGFLNSDSHFSKCVLSLLDNKIASQYGLNYNFFIRRTYPKECKFIADPRRYIHFLKGFPSQLDSDRTKFRQLAQDIDIKLKPRLFCKITEDFRFYLQHNDYYGFQQISMTNAAVILAKEFGRVPRVRILAYQRYWAQTAYDIRRLVYFLEEFPLCKGKPIFDRYWIVESGRGTYALLGEVDSKSYFIIAWK
jgi:hypothetical protein